MLIRLEGSPPAITLDLCSSSPLISSFAQPQTSLPPLPPFLFLAFISRAAPANFQTSSSPPPFFYNNTLFLKLFGEQRVQRMTRKDSGKIKRKKRLSHTHNSLPFPHPDLCRLLIMAAGSLFPPWSNIGSTNLKTWAEPNWRVEPGRSTVVSVTRCPSTKVSASGPCGVTVTIPSLCIRLQWWGRIPGPSSWRQTTAAG